MKKSIYILFAFCAVLLTFVACDRENFGGKEQPGEEAAEGTVSLTSLKLAVDVAVNPVSRAASNVNTDNYTIIIYDVDNDNKQLVSWKYSEMPEVYSMKVGNYSVAAYSHEELPAEFENPFYFGKQDFVIREDEVTEITDLECYLQSIMVTVEYDEALTALLGNDVVTTVSIGSASLKYENIDTRAGYFKAVNASNLLEATFHGTVDGEKLTLNRGFADAKAGQHRIIRYSLVTTGPGDGDDDGSVGISITIDVECEVIEKDITIDPGEEPTITDPGDENGGDPDPGPGPGPEDSEISIVGDGFDINQTIVIPADASISNPYPVLVKIAAEAGIKHLHVEIGSSDDEFIEVLTEFLPTKFDLAYPGENEEGLAGLGLPYGAQVIDAVNVDFDITGFTGLLNIYSGTHTFKITVVDNTDNQESQLLTLFTY